MEIAIIVTGTVIITATLTTIGTSIYHFRKRVRMSVRLHRIIDEQSDEADELRIKNERLSMEITRLKNEKY